MTHFMIHAVQTVLSISWALAALVCIIIASIKKIEFGGLWGLVFCLCYCQVILN